VRRLLRLVPWFGIACGMVLLDAAPTSAEWRRLDSPNFVVIGDVGGGTLRDMALRFEGFRDTLTRVLSARATGTAVPTIVIVFPSDSAFRPFKPRYQGKVQDTVAGVFIGRRDVNYIAVVADGQEERLRVVFHEYAHLVTSNATRNLPVWLAEGLAEFYSAYRMGGGGRQAILGLPIGSHLERMQTTSLLPLRQLVGVTLDSPLYNEDNRRSVLYAQSWALTHMLLLGQPRRNDRLSEYLSKVDQGTPASDAWEQVFGADPIERDLQKYVRQQAFFATQYTFPEKVATFEATAVPIPYGDAESFLADFLIQQNRAPEAMERMKKAAPTPTAWRAVVGALLDMEHKNDGTAEKTLVSVPDVTDWLTAYRAGAALATVVERSGDQPRPEHVHAARRLLAIPRAADREMANGIARLVALELAVQDPSLAPSRSAIERARMMAPGRDEYVFLLARVLTREKEYAAARTLLGPMMSPVQPAEIRDYARRLMAFVGDVERVESGREFGAGPRAASAPADSASGGSTERPAGRRPNFRRTEANEERFEGVLDRIECSRGAVLFQMTPAPPVRLVATTLSLVDFITYRTDLTGTVSCGPVKDSPRVYVTTKPGEREGERVVVAVEFPPK
jgi:hypothetical protein